MQQMQDDQIIALYNARDERAIAETDRKYGDYCTSIAQNILHNMQDSEECVNDTWLITWNSIPPVCPPVLKHYLGKITRNLSLNRYKAKNRDAFYKCSMLETVVLPDSVTKIDYAAFELCGTQNGFHITLPKNLSVVNTSIFSQSGLVEIVIPESHTQIGEAMFMGCQDLRAVTLPAELQSIGRLAFSECDNLQKVEFYGTQEDWEAIEMPSNVRNQLTPLVEYVTE